MRTYKVNGEVSDRAYNVLGRIMDGLEDDFLSVEELKAMALEFCKTVIDEPENVARDHDGLDGGEG